MTFLYCFPTFLELVLHFSFFLTSGQSPLSDTKQVQPLFYPWIPTMLRHEEACWQTDRRSVWQQIVDRSCRGGPGSQQDAETDRSPRPDRSVALPVSSSSSAVNRRFYLSSLSTPRYLLTSDLEPMISCIPDLSPFTSTGHGQCPAIYQPVCLFCPSRWHTDNNTEF